METKISLLMNRPETEITRIPAATNAIEISALPFGKTKRAIILFLKDAEILDGQLLEPDIAKTFDRGESHRAKIIFNGKVFETGQTRYAEITVR